MAFIDLATLNANAAALKAKGFNPPGYVEDLGGDTAPATALDKAQAADAAAILGLNPAPQPMAVGMANAPIAPVSGLTNPSAATVNPNSGLAAPSGEINPSSGLAAPTATINPNSGLSAMAPAPAPVAPAPPPQDFGPAPAAGTFTDPSGKVIELDAAAIPHPAGPAPSAPQMPTGGGPGVAPKPVTFADKEAALLLPGQKEAFQNEQEFKTSQSAWTDTIVNKQLEIEAKVNEMNAEALQQQADAIAAEKREREEFDAYFSGEQAKLQAESDKIANTKMDLNRLFKGEKGWLAVTGAIAASIFGVMGAPATGGKNAGVEAIDRAINRDLELQARDMENQKQGVARKSTLLAQKYAVFGDKQRAMAAARIDAWKMAMAKADSYAAQSGQEVHALQAAKVREAGEREIAREEERWKLGVEQGWAEKKAREAAAAANAAAAAAKKKADLEEWKFKTWFADQSKADAEIKKDGGGTGGGANVTVDWDHANNKPVMGTVPASKADAKELKEASIAYTGLMSKLDEYEKLVDQYAGAGGGAKVVGSKVAPWQTDTDVDKEKGSTLHGMILGDANKLEKFGALDKGAQQLLGEVIGENPTGFGSAGKKAKIQMIKKKITEDYQNKLQTYGSAPPKNAPETEVGFKPAK